MRRRAAALLVLALSGCRTAAPVPAAPALSGKRALEITVLDVGAGEATLVDAPGGDSLLIDGGPPGPAAAVLFTTLRRHHALPPDHVVVSHLATSTVGGLVMLLAGRDGQPGTADDTVPRGVLLDYGKDFSCTSLECLGYGTLAPGHHTTARPGDRIDLGEGVVARVMAVNGQVVGGARVKVHDAAGQSVALLLTDGAFRYLTAGALPGGGEARGCGAAAGAGGGARRRPPGLRRRRRHLDVGGVPPGGVAGGGHRLHRARGLRAEPGGPRAAGGERRPGAPHRPAPPGAWLPAAAPPGRGRRGWGPGAGAHQRPSLHRHAPCPRRAPPRRSNHRDRRDRAGVPPPGARPP